MPASRKNAAKGKPKAEQPAAAETVEPAEADADSAAEESVAETPVPLNRAERRAKGKAHGQVQMTGRGKVARSTGPAAGPRMWANRRSG